MKIRKSSSNPLNQIRQFALLLLFSLFASVVAVAAPGDLDYSFGMSGTVLTEFDRGNTAQTILVQPDNKIVIAGTIVQFQDPGVTVIAVIRFDADGSLDSTFGTNGKVFTTISSRNAVGAGALQPDGKILIGGFTERNFGLIRYNPDGSLDSNFGDGGKVYTDFSAAPLVAKIHSILIQPDGRIIVVGGDENFNIYLARYNSNGFLDSTFGSGGKVTTRYVTAGSVGKSALLQPDGKIVVGGYINTDDSAKNSALFRYNTDGTLDNSFDNDGVVVQPLGSSHDSIDKILLRPDNKIIAVGIAVNAEQSPVNYTLSIYNPNGSLDSTFANNGISLLPTNPITVIKNALLQPDGKIVVTGEKGSLSGSRYRCHIARFNSNGTFDFTFGNGGKVNLPIGSSSRGYAIAIQSDQKLLVAGSGTTLGNRKANFALSRLQGGSGSIPTTATISGRVINDFNERGIGGVQVILSGGGLSTPLYARTNPFGFYRFVNLPVNAEYDLTVRAKKMPASFQNSVRLFLNGNEYAEDLLFNFPTKLTFLE